MQKLKFVLVAVAVALGSSCSTPNPDGIIQNGVEAQMREKYKFTRACYDSEFKKSKPKPEGYVVVRITLTEEGDVKDVVTLDNTFKNDRLENCLKYIVKSTRFDQAGVTMETFVEYAFTFKNKIED